MDTAIIIRTYVIENGLLTYQAGGGIVYDSSPEEEYQETVVKSQALWSALTMVIPR
jgi:anthranilate synthase component 1